MGIVTRKYSFQSKYDGVVIHGICMIPDQPIGILQMVHGMNEHKERYLSYMETMAGKGYVALMHDKSVMEKEDMGYCYASKEKGFVEDIFTATKKIRREFPGLPLILYGHSMGSLAVRAYLRQHDDAIDALVVTGCPGYNEGVPFGEVLVKAASLLKKDRWRSPFFQSLIVGNFEKRFRKENRKSAWLAAKESVAEAFEADPLCQFTYTLNGFDTLLRLESIVYKKGGYQMKKPQLPILFLSGMDDPCYISENKWVQAVERMSRLGYTDITAKRFEGMRHEIHNEEENEKVYQEVDKFCRRLVPTEAVPEGR